MKNLWFVLLMGIFSIGIMSCNSEKKSQTVEITKKTTPNSNLESSAPVVTESIEVETTNNEETKMDEPVEIKEDKTNTEKKVASSYLPTTTATVTDFDTDYLMGKFEPAKHKDFITISSKYASNSSMMMRKDAYEAFKVMHEAASREGVNLKIISATRPFNHQKRIWEAKWQGRRKVDGQLLPPTIRDPEKRALRILRYSSMPGTSRHHWGTDIDLNDLNNNYFETGTGKKVYDWLAVNAATYGFCQPYSVMDYSRLNGYQEEKWHWSYMPVSKILTSQYKSLIQNRDITGFDGSETAVPINMVDNYVLGISNDCH